MHCGSCDAGQHRGGEMNLFVILLLGIALFFMGATVMLMALVREYEKLLRDKEPLEPIKFWEDEADE